MARKNRSYPVGVAQEKVLNALGLTAQGFTEANEVFDSIGLEVTSKRDGRTSVPIVRIKARMDGGFNSHGEGESWQQYPDIDFSEIQKWVEE